VSIDDLMERYHTLLLDVYGVLLDKAGPLPGAVALIERLNREGKPYLILTNSASRLPETMAREFAALGLPIAAERILTSGMLLGTYLAEKGLVGRPCLVLGPEDSLAYVERAGGRALPPDFTGDAEVIVLADQEGFDCVEVMDRVLSLAIRRLEADLGLALVLCNPDLIYPVAEGRFGFTSGGLAAMLEAGLQERYPGQGHTFARLGKPHAPLFAEAERRAGTRDLVMIGDQLATDILGARGYGLDSALVETGLAPPTPGGPEMAPTFVLSGLGDRDQR